MSVKRARQHIEACRQRAEHFDEPLRSELIALSITLGNMMNCIDPQPEPPATLCLRCDCRPCTCSRKG